MEHGLRLVKEEMNLLRCDVEILQSSLSATDGDARTPRKRRGNDAVLAELDVNAAASISAEVDHIHARLKKLAFLLSDVDAKWISAIRMHNRIMHDLTTATSASQPHRPPKRLEARLPVGRTRLCSRRSSSLKSSLRL